MRSTNTLGIAIAGFTIYFNQLLVNGRPHMPRHTEYGRSFPEVSAKNLFLHQIDGYDDYQFATDLLKIS